MKKLIIFLAVIILIAIPVAINQSLTKINNYTDELIDKNLTYSEPEPEVIIKLATWYDYDLNREDQKCRSKDCYSLFNDTCASRDYPKGTMLVVERAGWETAVVCRVNDYGPEEWTGKDIDLSSHAFNSLSPLENGVIEVYISVWEE